MTPRLTNKKRQPGLIAWLPFFFLLISPVDGDDTRAVWVVRHEVTSRDRVAAIVDRARSVGLNALFVQVRGRGDAYYRSSIVPPGEGIEEEFDPLAACIELAGEAGLEVHAWVNVYLTWYPDRVPPSAHVLKSHPDWFMISHDGVDMGQRDLTVDLVGRGVEGRYVSPAHPAVSRHLLEVIQEIVDHYPVDGIHLDYARYPNEHYDYSPLAQAGFWAEANLEPPSDEGPSEGHAAWNRWRSEQITRFVRSVKQLLEGRGVQLSAAVKPDIRMAFVRYGQNWVHWMNRRYLDFVVPMFYTGTTDEIFQKMRTVRKYVQKGRIYAGLGAWNQQATDTFDQINHVKKARLNGYLLFSNATLISSPELLDGLRGGIGRKEH